MRVAILSANLGSFDKVVEPVEQELPEGVEQVAYHCFTDSDFPPITGLTPRFQYRIPKLFGWQMYPDYDVYLFLDGSMTLPRPDSLKWFMKHLGDHDAAFFKHPWRNTIQEEVDHIEEHLRDRKGYIVRRYRGGLHKEQLEDIKLHDYVDDHLFTSTAFIYRNNEAVRDAMKEWWILQSRYFSCDQVALPFAVRNLNVKTIPDNQYHSKYIKLVSEHK